MGGGHRQISYAYFTAFVSLLNNLELVQKLYLACTRRDKTMEVTKGNFVERDYKRKEQNHHVCIYILQFSYDTIRIEILT